MSGDLIQLWDKGVLLQGIWETIYLTFISSFVAYVFGLPIGVLLTVTDKDGIHPIPWLNKIIGILVNIFRSIPFIILMVACLPAAKFIVGTSLGNKAMIVMLVIAAIPYVARMTESSFKEVDKAMGSSTFKIIYKVLIPEAKPALMVGAVISLVTILGYSAMAGTIGGGGLGMIAISFGYQRFNNDIVWICVLLTVIIVQLIQEFGMLIARKADKRINK